MKTKIKLGKSLNAAFETGGAELVELIEQAIFGEDTEEAIIQESEEQVHDLE